MLQCWCKYLLYYVLFATAGCKRDTPPQVYVVNAGTEPVEFTNLFPIWNERTDVQEIVGSVRYNNDKPLLVG